MFLTFVLLMVPIYGQIYPKRVPFLVAFRPYAGNWRFSWHIVAKSAQNKMRKLNFLQMVSLAGGLPLQWPNAVNVMFDSFSTLSSAGTTLMIPDCELTTMRTAEAFYMKQISFHFFAQ